MDNSDFFQNLQAGFTRLSFSAAKRVEFYDLLRALITDGKPLDASLKVVADRSKTKDPLAVKVINHCLSLMIQGKHFATGLRRFVPESEAEIILATERKGDLAKGFAQAAYLASKQAELKAKVVSSLMGPAFTIVALLGLLAMMGGMVGAEILTIVDKSYLNTLQRTLFATGGFIYGYWWLIILMIGAVCWLAAQSMTRFPHTGSIRRFVDKRVPPWSIYNAVQGASMLAAISSMMSAGTPVGEAIDFIRKGARKNHYVRNACEMMVERLKAGKRPGAAMDVDFFSDKTALMLSAYSDSGEFVKAMGTIGEATLNNAIKSVERQMGMLKTFMMLAMGAAVLWVMLSIVTLSQAFDKMKANATPGAAQTSQTK